MSFSKIQISTETKGDVWCPIPRGSLQLLVSLSGKMSAGHIRGNYSRVHVLQKYSHVHVPYCTDM